MQSDDVETGLRTPESSEGHLDPNQEYMEPSQEQQYNMEHEDEQYHPQEYVKPQQNEEQDEEEEEEDPADWWDHVIQQGCWFACCTMMRNELPPTPPEFPQYVSRRANRRPWFVPRSPTLHCAAAVALLLTVHLDIDSGRLYPLALWRFLRKPLLTLAIAVFSGFTLDLAGAVLDGLRDWSVESMLAWLDRRLFVGRLGWGEVVEGADDEDREPIWFVDRWGLRRATREVTTCSVGLATTYFGFRALVWLQDAGITLLRLCGPRLSSALTDADGHFVFRLPTPAVNEAGDLHQLFMESVPPAAVQILLATFLWFLMALAVAKPSEDVTRGRRDDANFVFVLAWNMLRIVAMHLLSFTTYQLVCFMTAWFRMDIVDRFPSTQFVLQPWFKRGGPLPINLIAAMMIPGIAYGLNMTCYWLARGGFFLWRPFMLWFTIWKGPYVDRVWQGVHFSVMEKDMGIIDAEGESRVTTRMVMTVFCGLRSSWPTSLNLNIRRFRPDEPVEELNIFRRLYRHVVHHWRRGEDAEQEEQA
ncbi:hypothetical protein F4778DRAFT_143619 [Xylariomycetidae sp. FL2044]|nr:hypothetical protein F4778DRAFT_143619 [Xylariomycetidae sp. FL2044]